MMKVLKYSLTILLALSFAQAVAQPGSGPGSWERRRGPRREKMRERIETIKIWQLTDEVGLTTEQSERFFPIYNRHQDDHRKLEEEKFSLLRSLDSLSEKSDVPDSQIKKTIDQLTEIDGRMIALRKSFLNEISGVLSIKQVAKLLVFEEQFRRRLQNHIDEIRRGMGERRRDLPE
jgi:hypothetical protein